jgi:hypothetical protein
MTAPPLELYSHSHTRLTRRYNNTLSQYENATIAITATLTHNASGSDSNT